MSQGINREYIDEYLRKLLPPREGLLACLEQEAATEQGYVPIAQPETANFLCLLIKISGAKRLLEIGTGLGYSAIRMAEAAGDGGSVTTIERYSRVAERARDNICRAGLKRVMLIEGEAAEVFPHLTGGYDMIFLDAAKGQYAEFLPFCIDLLRAGGLLVTDNVLYKGMVAADELVVRRKITIVERLRDYLKQISAHPQLDTAILPIGDGVAVSRKKCKAKKMIP